VGSAPTAGDLRRRPVSRQVRRRGSNSHGQGPPASEAGASANSATSARSASACDGRHDRRSHGQRSGPRRTRTVFVLLAGEVHRHVCVGPMGPRGRSRTCRAKKRLGYGQVPSHDGGPRRGTVVRPCRWQGAAIGPICWRSLQLSRCYLDATNQSICANRLVALAAAQRVEPCLRRVWRPPGYRCPAPSYPVVRTAIVPEIKRAAPLRKRLERSRTCESPVQTVENAPLGRNPKGIAWPKAAHDVTRVANRPHRPSIHR
jgi:hypothetical protein